MYELKRSLTLFFITHSIVRPSLPSGMVLSGSGPLCAVSCRVGLDSFLANLVGVTPLIEA
jgi:hypothetical protein